MCNTKWKDMRTQVEACALTGAAAFFAGIPDAVLVANGPLWCYFYALRQLEKQWPAVSSQYYCTQVDNHAVVYGTEEFLLETLHTIRRQTRPSVVLIENSCSVSLIGDDIAGVAKQADLNCPVVFVDGGGLSGGFGAGYRAAAKGYLKQVPFNRKSAVQPGAVNLLGCTIGYYNGANDVAELKRMLHMAGYQVLACPGAGSRTDEIANMTNAALNIVVHDELGQEMAKILYEQYGMPYVSLLPPYGVQGSLAWLETIHQHMPVAGSQMTVVRQEVNTLEQKLQSLTLDMQRTWGDLWFEKTLIAAPASVALSMAEAVRTEWLDTGLLTVVAYDRLPSYPAASSIDTLLAADGDSQLLEKELAALEGGLLLGSSNEKAILHQCSVPDVVCQNIALPVYDEVILSDLPFMGLRGSCHMVERLWNQYVERCQRHRNFTSCRC